MDGLVTRADPNVLLLGSCDFLTGMNWLEEHKANLDEERKLKVVTGIPKVISGKKSSAMQLKNFYGKRLQSVCNSCFGGNRE